MGSTCNALPRRRGGQSAQALSLDSVPRCRESVGVRAPIPKAVKRGTSGTRGVKGVARTRRSKNCSIGRLADEEQGVVCCLGPAAHSGATRCGRGTGAPVYVSEGHRARTAAIASDTHNGTAVNAAPGGMLAATPEGTNPRGFIRSSTVRLELILFWWDGLGCFIVS
jgi:hypothetical protein